MPWYSRIGATCQTDGGCGRGPIRRWSRRTQKAEPTAARRRNSRSLRATGSSSGSGNERRKHEPAVGDSITLTIEGTKWAFGMFQAGEIVALDPSTNPKLLDLKSIRKGGDDTVNEAIYKVDGDTLIICIYQGKDKKRPTSFDKPTEGETVLWTLKRPKK